MVSVDDDNNPLARQFMNTVSAIIGVVVVVTIGSWAYNSFIKQEWIGLYESRTTNAIFTESFSSREECESWVYHKRAHPGAYTNYECGKNCEPPATELGLYKCQETF